MKYIISPQNNEMACSSECPPRCTYCRHCSFTPPENNINTEIFQRTGYIQNENAVYSAYVSQNSIDSK